MGEAIVAKTLQDHGIEAQVRSGGVRASVGEGACEAMWVGSEFEYPRERTAYQVTAADLASSDVVLTFERGHRSDLIAMHPAARERIFTFTEAASLAKYVVAADGPLAIASQDPTLVDDDDAVLFVPPLPDGDHERIRWFVAEMNAARGIARIEPVSDSVLTVDGESIIDPLFVETDVHADVARLTYTYANTWTSALAQCVRFE